MARATTRPRPKPYEERLLRLAAWILDQEAPVTREQMYAEFSDHYRGKADAKERMFTRDKDALKRLGFNIETAEVGGEDQLGYTIDAHASMLQPIELTPDEASVAWTAGLGALRLSPHPMRDELEGALRKLLVGTKTLPPRAVATEELASDGGDSSDALVAKLADAWERRRRIRIDYWRAASGEVVSREVDVYGWARRRGEWIFVGYCHLRSGVRIFYLSRVRSLVVARIPSDVAKARARLDKKGDYDIPEGFDIRRWSRQQIWDYDVHPPLTATVRFRGSLAAIATQLVPGARTSSDGEGGRVAQVDVRNLRGLVRQALAWGAEAEVTSPPEARALAREILASCLSTPEWGTP